MKVFKKGILVIATALFCVATVFGQEKSITVKADKVIKVHTKRSSRTEPKRTELISK